MCYALDVRKKKLRSFETEQIARNHGNGSILFTTPEELASNGNTTIQLLVNAYNNHSKEIVKKFSDKLTGSKRVFQVAQSLEVEGWLNQKASAPKEKPIQKNKKTAGSLSKKMIRSLVVENPRRKGTMAFDALQILIGLNGKPISFEEYVKKGGRRNDLAYDIVNGWAEVCGDAG